MCRRVLVLAGAPASEVSLVFCGDRLIRRLNKKYLKRDAPTDVIAFTLADSCVPGYLGEVVVSVEEAVRNAPVYGASVTEEIRRYVVHGILHLAGYTDHTKKGRAAMERKQEEILAHLAARSW